ncbi:Exonuclease 3'-5' domain-containing protein 1 [Carex littledalei]|uniref:Exonuclease 3'-5' domain-containing protein 1 n=1 Tax=Carex littledalei TaxID=544730 RepID=A0A833QMD8_9POAL|nr:Exonuclease 3'-5' domain-containing protein 1 [Carex littledalei]
MDASNSNPHTSFLNQSQPHSSITSGGNNFTAVPIHIVTQQSQLPVEFLKPSPENQLVIGLDCEGVDLSRYGTLCIMQLAFSDAIYIVDAIEGGAAVMEACKPALESNYVTKALYFQFGIKLNNVMDTQVAYSIIEEQEGQIKRVEDDYMSFVAVLADPRYCGVSYHEKEQVRDLLRQDPSFWIRRPLSEIMIKSATDDVKFLLSIYQKMVHKLSNQSLSRVFVRGALYCRCFCLADTNAEWPPLSLIPGAEQIPEREILSILNIPSHKMGPVIGKKGSFIRFVRQSSKAKIFAEGTAKKVFIIGRPEEVRRAKALIQGKILEV